MPENNNDSYVITFPNSIAWAFNPNYIEVTAPLGSAVPYVEITVGSLPAIKAVLYNGHAKVYISRLLQICFTAPKTERVKNITIQIEEAVYTGPVSGDTEGGWLLATQTITTVWGGVNLGERAYNYGVYSYEQGHGWLTSHIQCFINFPFTLELLVANGSTLNRRAGSSGYSQVGTYNANQMVTITKNNVLGGRTHGIVTYRQDISPNGLNTGGTFDQTFDYTFHTPADTTVITQVHLRQEQEGFYLRWISHFGFMQYYLFDRGDKTTKTTRTGTLPEETLMDGMYFGGAQRTINIKGARSMKMCAMNLNPETLEYVQDIISSPFVDLYIGRDKNGNDIWQPVRMADNSYVVKTQHNYLSDFEITIESPDLTTQAL